MRHSDTYSEFRPAELESKDPLEDIKKAKPIGKEIAEFSLIDQVSQSRDTHNLTFLWTFSAQFKVCQTFFMFFFYQFQKIH